MSIAEICQLKVQNITTQDAILFLWTIDGCLEKALEVTHSWGFRYRTIGFVWVKSYKSGKLVLLETPWFMKSVEHCLFATKGHPHHLLKTRSTRQLITSPKDIHSTKPSAARHRIELMFPKTRKIELFARKKYPGWDAWGNEVECDITL